MKNDNSVTINDIVNCLTEMWNKHGYDVEVSCLHTYEADQFNNLEHHDYCCDMKRNNERK